MQLGGLGVAGALLAACSTREPAAGAADDGGTAAAKSGAATSGPVTVTDAFGTTLTFDNPVERLATAIMPLPAMVAGVAGTTDVLVGVNEVSVRYAKEGMLRTVFPAFLDTPTIAGNDFMPNVEELLAQDPQVVITWGDKGDDIIEPIRAAGLPVLLCEYGTQERLEFTIGMLGDLLGAKDRAQATLDRFADVRQTVQKAADSKTKPRVLYLYNVVDQLTSAAEDSYMHYWIDLAGGENVAAGAGSGSNASVTLEQVLAWDPEVIVISNYDPTTPAELLADERFSTLPAVRDQRVYKAPIGAYAWDVPCTESDLMWQWASTVLHGAEHDLRAKAREVFADQYGYDLTDADLDQILHAEANSGSAGYASLLA
ncbi:hypothetical protein GCM10007967_18030 [Xylanimonas ulmi]